MLGFTSTNLSRDFQTGIDTITIDTLHYSTHNTDTTIQTLLYRHCTIEEALTNIP